MQMIYKATHMDNGLEVERYFLSLEDVAKFSAFVPVTDLVEMTPAEVADELGV